MTLTQIEALRAEYQPSDIEREFALSNPRPRTPDRRTTVHHDRRATAEERRLLHRFGSPVPLEPAGSDADGRGEFRLPIDNPASPGEPQSPPPPKPAAITPPVVPGVLPRELRLPRSDYSPLERDAEAVYRILTHEARVLLRLLDHAYAATSGETHFWAVPFQFLTAAFAAEEPWEAEAAVWRAVDELIERQVACLIPGHFDNARVLFVSSHDRRSMLRPRVLHDRHAIVLVSPGDDAVRLAADSLRTSNAA
jgi:hypothetical protein